jgi:acyl-CoA dehydrogenase
VKLELPEETQAFGQAAAKAFATRLGGVEAARDAERDPTTRSTHVAPVLEDLGAFDLDVSASLEAALAGAQLCRMAGRVALPYPLPAVLAGRLASGDAGLPLALVDDKEPCADHADLYPAWLAATPDGRLRRASPAGGPLRTKLGFFAGRLALEEPDGAPGELPPEAHGLALALGCFVVLGTLEEALSLTAAHVTAREQFGRPLSTFQAVQFQVADATVAVLGLEELAKYTLWRLFSEPRQALVDALALRVQALDAARLVLRTAHQLHGAIGFCDEHDLSVLSRHLQPLLRLPTDLEVTTARLLAAIDEVGFAGLFPLEPLRGADAAPRSAEPAR